jgi:hypothetical protein
VPISTARRAAILKEFDYKCVACGFNQIPALEIHHLWDKNDHNEVLVMCANCHLVSAYNSKILTMESRKCMRRTLIPYIYAKRTREKVVTFQPKGLHSKVDTQGVLQP